MPPSKCSIAIVEDDVSFRRALERFLRASGFEPHTFASAEDFLHSVESESTVCLIIDLHLPGMSGFELFNHLAASAWPRPAVFITAHNQEGLPERASQIPGTVFLRKPFVGAVLLEALNSLVPSRGSPVENPGT
jgi:FixJ family two-component response regulator